MYVCLLVFGGVSNIPKINSSAKWVIYFVVTLIFIFGLSIVTGHPVNLRYCKDISKNTCDIIKEKEISLADNGIMHAFFMSFT